MKDEPGALLNAIVAAPGNADFTWIVERVNGGWHIQRVEDWLAKQSSKQEGE